MGAKQIIYFKVQGDSMDDGTKKGFSDGDSLQTSEYTLDEFRARIKEDLNSYWLIKIGDSYLLKQVIAYRKDDSILIHSLNPEYKDQILSLGETSNVYRVNLHQPIRVSYGMDYWED